MPDQPITDEPEFPRDLARCRCGSPSFDADDHSNACPLGPTPPLSTNPAASTLDAPVWWLRPF